MKISALILTKNEQEMIEECLKQLNFVDEIVILDQKSQDRTLSIAKRFTKNIYLSDSADFSENRTKLAKLAKGKWLLYLDADERLTKELTSEIKQAIKDPRFSAYLGPQSESSRTRTAECSAFYIPRKNLILGRWARHGGWWPDYLPRLFKKDKLLGWQGRVHETPQVKGPSGYFKNPLIHLTARNLSQVLSKTIKWAKIEAELFYKANHPKVTILRIIKSMIFEFSSRYLFKLGFLDGATGLIQAIYQALHQAIILTYLWELQNKSGKKFLNFQNSSK